MIIQSNQFFYNFIFLYPKTCFCSIVLLIINWSVKTKKVPLQFEILFRTRLLLYIWLSYSLKYSTEQYNKYVKKCKIYFENTWSSCIIATIRRTTLLTSESRLVTEEMQELVGGGWAWQPCWN